MKYVYALLILLMALTLAAFIQQNGQSTVLRYFAWQTPALPLSLFMVVSFAFGYLLATLLGFTGGIRRKVRHTLLDRENRRLKEEIARRDSEGLVESGQATDDDPATGRFEQRSAETVLLEGYRPGLGEDDAGEEEI